MKVVHVEDFAIKGLKKRENSVFFIEGIKRKMILYYNYTNKKFLLTPVVCVSGEKKIDELINDIESRVSLINKLKIQIDNVATINKFQLGKVLFRKSFFKNGESEFYLEQAKNALLKVNDRHPDNTKAHIYGYAEFDEDIWNFVGNLKKVNIEELKNQPKQLEIKDFEC